MKIKLRFNFIKFYNLTISKKTRESIREKINENYHSNNFDFKKKKRTRRYKEIIRINQNVYTFEVRMKDFNQVNYRIIYIEDERKHEEKKEKITFLYGLKMRMKKELKMYSCKDVEFLMTHNIKQNPYDFNVMNMEFNHSIYHDGRYFTGVVWQDKKNNTIVKFVDIINDY